MTAALLAGAGAGVGVILVWLAVMPPRPTLAAALDTLRPPARSQRPPTGRRGWASMAGRRLAPVLDVAGLPRRSIRADLAICELPAAIHLAEQATAALSGALLPPALYAVTVLAGAPWPWPIPTWGALVGAVGGLLLPDLLLRSRARQRRDDFAYALSAFLDITVITLASGAGIEHALTQAAAAGYGWPYERLRHCLDAATTTRRPLWEPLDDLGRTLNVTDLRELATSLRLAGDEGARIRASLTSRAVALRLRQRTTAEARAQAAGERMSLPVVALMTAFMIFIMYPAVAAVLGDL